MTSTRDVAPKEIKSIHSRSISSVVLELEELLERARNGDVIGIGTDFTQGYGQPFFDWITHDKGYARKLTDFGDVINPEGIRTIGDFPNLTATMQKRGWNETRIRKIVGENWLRMLCDVWGT